MDKGLQSTLALVGGVGGYLFFKLGAWPAETKIAMLIALAIATIGYPIGWLVGRYISADPDVDGRGYLAIAVAGVAGVLIPVVGMAMSAIIWQFHKNSETRRILYAGLSSLVCLLAAANAALGAAAASV